MKDKRYGKFRINSHIIDECPHQVLAIMKDMIIVRAEMHWAFDGIEYVGIHPAFAAVPPGQMMPEYYPAITTNGDATVRKVEWKLCT